MTQSRLPPGQQLAAPGKWPVVGERESAAISGPWSITMSGCIERPGRWTLAELMDMPQTEQTVDVHCVTRWSMLDVGFSGVALDYLLALAVPTADARFLSFVANSPRRHSSSLSLVDARQFGHTDRPELPWATDFR
jgi:DMSO/TMAO reductase YedYZ molybdopterin-dependent catalytic subunit